MKTQTYEFWFITGSQFLYGPQTLKKVEEDSNAIVDFLNKNGDLPFPIVYKDTVKTNGEITQIIKEANFQESCGGVITFCHTFSPSKMWINGLSMLQKPYLHLHTQLNEVIPNEEIDMDYMNLHQSAHGDREHGFIGTRMRMPRKVVAGYWKDKETQIRIGKWMRVAVAAAFSKSLKVMRFGDNMREVAVTEGDKVEAQIKLGWQVNTYPVGMLAETINGVTEAQVDEKINQYKRDYDFATDNIEQIRYQAREEIAIQQLLDNEGCVAYTNTFEDLYGMKQLPGLATQNLMAQGYGFGAEGDWKTAAMTAIIKQMCNGLGCATFMEDYTYDMKNGITLGAHMLEVCPSVARDKARIEVHDLGIGGKEAPARLVFEGKEGKAIAVSLVDMGGRLRLIVQDVNCIKPTQTMPNLPVARLMWKALPNLYTGAECWIMAGGAHHTVLCYGCDGEMLRDWARIMDIEFVHINAETTPQNMERELFMMDIAWKLK